MYCQAWASAVEAQEHIDKFGPVIKTTNGNLIQNPYVAIRNRAMDQVLIYGRELGLSPSSRSRLLIKPPQVSVAEQLFAIVRGVHQGDDSD